MSKNRGLSSEEWNARKEADRNARAQDKAQRDLNSFLNQSITRRELIGQVQPIFTAANNHETALAFIIQRGLEIRDGRAYLNMDDLNKFAEELKAQQEQAPVTAEVAPEPVSISPEET